MAFCNGGRSEDPATVSKVKYMCNTLKAHTKDAHTVCGGPTLKTSSVFGRIGPRTLWEVSLWATVIMSEVIENHLHQRYRPSIEVFQSYLVDLNNHQCKHRRRFRRDREPSRIPIRSLKRLRNKSRKVREFVYARILSCRLHYIVMWMLENNKIKRRFCSTAVEEFVKVEKRLNIPALTNNFYYFPCWMTISAIMPLKYYYCHW